MLKLIALPVGFLGLLTSALVTAPPAPETQDVSISPVAGRVSVLVGQGGNIGLCAGDDGVLMIDSQFANLSERIAAAIQELAGTRPSFLVNTHWHGDHTGGNENFSGDAVVVAHTNVRRRLNGDARIGGRTEKKGKATLPVVTYDDGMSIHFNGEEIRLVHVPTAHTDGDTVVWFRGSNVVHMGDLYFDIGYPFIDVSSGGNALGLIEGLHACLEWIPKDARIISGHGRATGVEELKSYLAMLEEITGRVREAVEAGQSLDAIQKAGLTVDYDERWGDFDFVPPENFVKSIVDSL